jgi:hypothetical protein
MLLLTAPHWAGGLGRSYGTGAIVMRRKVHDFFYALHLWWAYVEAVKLAGPVPGRPTRIRSPPKSWSFWSVVLNIRTGAIHEHTYPSSA